jgi:aminopeptidase N
VYSRGAMTLQALRSVVGDDAFFRILRRWYARNRYGNVTTADFVALSERVSGQGLDDLFDAWLYKKGRPAACDA